MRTLSRAAHLWLRLAARAALMVGLLLSPAAAQTPAEYQRLQKEVDALRVRQDALQAEVERLRQQVAGGSRPAAVAAAPQPPDAPVTLDLSRAPLRGNPAAKVTLVEVGDFQCPFCGRHFRQTAPQILKDYVETGRVSYVFLNLPLQIHPLAFKAAEAAECARDQGHYWEMHEALYASQGALALPQLLAYGQRLQLDGALFRTCLDAGAHVNGISADVAQVQRIGVTATPTFFVGTLDPKTHALVSTTRIVGAKPLATFQAALDAALMASGAAGR